MGLDISLQYPTAGQSFSAGTTSVPLWALGSVSIDTTTPPRRLYTVGNDRRLTFVGEGRRLYINKE